MKYNPLTKSYQGAHTYDTIMPGGQLKALPENNLTNGAPFGPVNHDKPYWPEDKVSKTGSVDKGINSRRWKDISQRIATI